ncbi:MAG: hypothetical protein HY013_11765 [Candidatus Solibacter usitatus]|nr:hypothetical protein [Candidatus Solibacter usitatus]
MEGLARVAGYTPRLVMNRICAEAGAGFAAVRFTTGGEEPADRVFEERCRRAGVRYVSLRSHFVRPKTSYMARLPDGGYDPHYGPAGTLAYAQAIAPVVESILSAAQRADGVHDILE